MVWFKVDDKLHSHPKAAAASLEAIGLWTLAGSWCGDQTTDGNIPEHMIRSLSRGAIDLADELVRCGLWRRTKSGYRFHQWQADSDGTKRNPTKKEIEEARRKKADAGRKGGLASGWSRKGKGSGNTQGVDNGRGGRKPGATSGNTGSSTQAGAKASASQSVEPPTRPLPSSKEGRASPRRAGARGADAAPPSRDSPVCPACGNRADSSYHRNVCEEGSQS